MATPIPNNLVSIVIPTYNRPTSLARAIHSVLRQTYQNLEIIVVDDGTNPETAAVVQSFKTAIPIVYIRNDRNLGVATSRNVGMKTAEGSYIALLDDDDEFLESKIERQLNVALSLKEKALIVCNGYAGSDRGHSYQYDIHKPSGYIPSSKHIFPVRHGLPTPSSWFFHRELMEAVGCFDEQIPRWEDTECCVRLMMQFPVYMINELLVRWHTSPDSFTYGPNSGLNEPDVRARIYFLNKHFDLMRKDREYAYRFCWALAKDLRKMGKPKEAKEYFRKAFFIKPYKIEALANSL